MFAEVLQVTILIFFLRIPSSTLSQINFKLFCTFLFDVKALKILLEPFFNCSNVFKSWLCSPLKKIQFWGKKKQNKTQ